MSPLSADEELHALAANSSQALYRTLRAMLRAKLEREDESEIHKKLRLQLSQTLALSSLLGRRRVLLQARAKGRGAKFIAAAARTGCGDVLVLARDIVSPFVPRAEFSEAIDDLLKRYPTLAPGYKQVQQAYARGHAFALAKSTDETLTRKVQKVIADAIKQGSGQFKAVKVIAAMGDWTHAYAENVFRTNAATAYVAGVVAQAMDPEIMEICPAMAVIGRSVPPSDQQCISCVGLLAGTKSPLWNKYAPPYHYQCGHGLNQVDRWELKDRGLLHKDGSVREYHPPGFNNESGPSAGFGQGQLSRRLGMVT